MVLQISVCKTGIPDISDFVIEKYISGIANIAENKAFLSVFVTHKKGHINVV